MASTRRCGSVVRFWRRSFRSPKWSQGWRLTAALACAAAFVVLFANISLLVWHSTSAPIVDGVKVLYAGDCDVVSRIDTWLHLLINVFSTLLLAGSYFCKLS